MRPGLLPRRYFADVFLEPDLALDFNEAGAFAPEIFSGGPDRRTSSTTLQ